MPIPRSEADTQQRVERRKYKEKDADISNRFGPQFVPLLAAHRARCTTNRNLCPRALDTFVGYLLRFANQRNRPGRPPSVPPSEEPSEEKNPLGREALARALSSSAGMPRVRPRRLVSTPKRPESPCSAAIWRWKAVLLNASWFCCA